ncbi:MAG: filamentous hemagglutinin N-terminal domain-containing protein [Cyanobacteria bacterium J06627_8]
MSKPSFAQIQIDGTTSTTVGRERLSTHEDFSRQLVISGESRSRNNRNLFHSFEQFNIPQHAIARFETSGAENILVRVTGNRRSRLSGRLETDNPANFFLLNPNGIVFRDNAQIDIAGTFLATTADEIAFGNRGEFSTIDSDADTSLLTVQPSALRFLGNEQGSIRNRADLNLTHSMNSSFILIGNVIRLNENTSNIDEGNIRISNSHLQLAAVAGIGDVEYDADTQTVNIPEALRRGRVLLGDILIDVGTGQLSIDAGLIQGVSTTLQNSRDGEGDLNLRATNAIAFTEGSIISFFSGNIFIESDNAIQLNASRISSSETEDASSGNILFRSKTFTASDSSSVTASTNSTENAGEIILNISEVLQITNNSRIESSAALPIHQTLVGRAGNITIRTPLLRLQNDAEISTSAFGAMGRAGDITIQAETLSLNEDSKISAGLASGLIGGSVTLRDLELLLLQNGSTLSAEALANGDGGNLNIDADLIVAIPDQNNDLVANAFEGRGGNINITTQGLFGLDVRPRDAGEITNDIDASSQFGVDGVVSINRLEVDPSQSLSDLPDEVVNVAALIDNSFCQALGISEFVNVGDGGIPPSQAQQLSSDATWEDWRIASVPESPTVVSSDDKVAISDSAASLNEPVPPPMMVEAVGWVVKDDGAIELVSPEPQYATPVQIRHASACR